MASKLQETTERLFEKLANRPLSDWVKEQREAGKSWRQLERDLRLDYGIDITNVTLISWYRPDDEAVA